MKFYYFTLIALLASSCATNPGHFNHEFKIIKTQQYKLENPPVIGTTLSSQKILLGGFSGLSFKGKNGGDFEFWACNGRGPISPMINKDRPFLLPEYNPAIYTLKTNSKSSFIEVESKIDIKKKNNSTVTGLPSNRDEENPVDVFGFMTSIDSENINTSSIANDDEGGFWLGDNYAPSLIHIDPNGKILKRLNPGIELPKLYLERKTNKGFDAIAKIDNRLIGLLQDPLEIDPHSIRIAEVDLETLKTEAEYFYKLDASSEQLSDAVALGNKSILVLEQNGKSGINSYKRIYKIVFNKSDEVVTKSLVVNLDQSELRDQSKIEGLTIIDKKHIALINNNDFAIAEKTDTKSGLTPLNNQVTIISVLELDQDLI